MRDQAAEVSVEILTEAADFRHIPLAITLHHQERLELREAGLTSPSPS